MQKLFCLVSWLSVSFITGGEKSNSIKSSYSPLLHINMTHISSPRNEFIRGIKESSPILIGLLPWALILGIQGGQKGMSWLEMLLMTGMNFAGGSEFATVNLWAEPLPILLIATITFMINSRHILMGAALAPHMKEIPLKKAVPALFFMCDESWAMAFSEIQKRKAAGIQYAFLYGRMLYPLHYLDRVCHFRRGSRTYVRQCGRLGIRHGVSCRISGFIERDVEKFFRIKTLVCQPVCCICRLPNR